MINSGYAGLPVWEGLDAPDWPTYTAMLAAATDSHLVQHVEDISERNTRLAAAPVGTVAASTTDGTVWFKADSGWKTWWEPVEAWRTLTPATGFTALDTAQVRRLGNLVYIRGKFLHDGSDIPINGVRLTSVPSDCIPSRIVTLCSGISLAGPNEIPTARLEIYGSSTTSSFGGPGSVILWLGSGQTSVNWAAIDGPYWID